MHSVKMTIHIEVPEHTTVEQLDQIARALEDRLVEGDLAVGDYEYIQIAHVQLRDTRS